MTGAVGRVVRASVFPSAMAMDATGSALRGAVVPAEASGITITDMIVDSVSNTITFTATPVSTRPTPCTLCPSTVRVFTARRPTVAGIPTAVVAAEQTCTSTMAGLTFPSGLPTIAAVISLQRLQWN